MERADLLALVCDVYCDFVTFQFGNLGQAWYLIVSIPNPERERGDLLTLVCYFPIWYPGTGVVLDCIDSKS